MYSYFYLMRHAYHKSFTRKNISSLFCRAGLWPIDSPRLLFSPPQHDADDIGTVLSPQYLDKLMEEKRCSATMPNTWRRCVGADVLVFKHNQGMYADLCSFYLCYTRESEQIREEAEGELSGECSPGACWTASRVENALRDQALWNFTVKGPCSVLRCEGWEAERENMKHQIEARDRLAASGTAQKSSRSSDWLLNLIKFMCTNCPNN